MTITQSPEHTGREKYYVPKRVTHFRYFGSTLAACGRDLYPHIWVVTMSDNQVPWPAITCKRCRQAIKRNTKRRKEIIASYKGDSNQ